MSLYDNLPHTCDISAGAIHQEAGGGDVDIPVLQESGRRCWAQPASKSTVVEFQKRDQRVTHTVYFLGDPDVKPGHILAMTSGPFDGRDMEVVAEDETTAGLGLLWGVQCEDIQSR